MSEEETRCGLYGELRSCKDENSTIEILLELGKFGLLGLECKLFFLIADALPSDGLGG